MAADTLRRAHAALDQLVAAGTLPSVTAVAHAAGLARSTVYRHPELLDAITAARSRPQTLEAAATSHGRAARHDPTPERLRDEVATLRATVEQLAQVVQVLTLDNEHLRQQLADRNDQTVTAMPPSRQHES